MLSKITFKRRVGVLVGVAVAGIVALSAFSVVSVQRHVSEGREAQLVTAVQATHSVVAAYQAQAAAGRISQEDAQRAAKAAIRGARYGGADGRADYLYAFTLDGTGVAHPLKPEWEGQGMVGKVKDSAGTDVIKTLLDALASSRDGHASVTMDFPRPGSTEPVPKLQYVVKVEGWNWMLGSGLYLDDARAAVRSAVLAQLAIGGALLLVIGGMGWAVARSVLRQIGGEPAEALAVVAQVAQGNLAVHLPAAPEKSLLHGLAAMVQSLRGTVAQVRESTDGISTASNQIASGNQDLSSRTEQAASSLQQTAATMAQLADSTRSAAGSAESANGLARDAAAVARRGGEAFAQVARTMGDIDASSARIADITNLIDGIAFQTNILALNAAVEAARAGEQGRGFAVVAQEVRSLAQRSASAAQEIKQLIGASTQKVQDGSRLVQDAGATMRDIEDSVQRVAAVIGEISAGAGHQASGFGEVNQAVGQLDQITQQNAALVEEAAAAAQSLRDQAVGLARAVSAFRLAPV